MQPLYEIRYATSAITDASWTDATLVTGGPTPAAPGQQENFTVSGLSPATQYYFAIKSTDSSFVSALSNCPSGTTELPDPTAPAAVADLVATTTGRNLTLTWTAAGDDGTTGTATTYDIRYSTFPIGDDAAFAAATVLTGLPAPKAAGSAEASS